MKKELKYDWTPQSGEWVEALIYNVWEAHVFVTYWDEKYWIKRNDVYQLHPCSKIRQIKPETMTLQEVREALGKPNLVISEQLPPLDCSKCGRSGYSMGRPFCTDEFCNGGNLS
jgi:hypothetical protein